MLYSFLDMVHPGGLWHPAADNAVPLCSSIFCAGDPDAALNAGHHRLLTKLGERGGGFCVCAWKTCTRLKIACPPVNASPLKTAGPGSCLHSPTYKLILSLCCYLVTTPPLRPPFVVCFVRAPSGRQSQPHKKSSFRIHWPPMNTGNFLFCAFIHKSVITHQALSVRLKRFFMEHFLLLPSDTFCQFTHVGNQPNRTRLIFRGCQDTKTSAIIRHGCSYNLIYGTDEGDEIQSLYFLFALTATDLD